MSIVTTYQEALQDIYDHVGFVEDWVILPLDIRTEMFWSLTDDAVRYGKTAKDVGEYEDEIYTQRFYKKHVYEGERYTAVMVDTHVDGNRFLAIFENSKRVTE